MTDEKFLFIQDVRDKKRTARGAYNRRTHTGRSGGVKLPSDYLTKKECEKMSGEPTTYKISAPMTWQEFKAMPDDLKKLYLNWIREKFDAPDSAIADMLGVHRTTLCGLLNASGLQNSKRRGSRVVWDTTGFSAWRNGAAAPVAALEDEAEDQGNETVMLDPLETVTPMETEAAATETTAAQAEPLQPTAGHMQFDGPADQALQVIANVLRGAHVRLTVTWSPGQTEGPANHGTEMG